MKLKQWLLSLVKKLQIKKKYKHILELQSRITELEKINNILLNNMTTGGGITEKIKKITPRPFLHGISFHLAEHCNLNCFSCD
ncbi:radical SAM protein, partial [Campylobacter jejuni]|nr:radical SAM protein [Campylobacter jejuni]